MNIPSAPETERTVISALLFNSQNYRDNANQLIPECFYDRKNSAIYESITQLQTRGEDYSLATLLDYFKNNNLWEEVGDRNEIISLFSQHVNQNLDLSGHIKILRNEAFKRALIQGGEKISTLAGDSSTDTSEILDRAKEILEGCSSLRNVNPLKKVGDLELIKEFVQYIESEDNQGMPTGIPGLDYLIVGFKPAKLYLIGGRTAMGKTQLAVFFARIMSQKSQYPILFLSAEMAWKPLLLRFVAGTTGANSNRISPKNYNPEQWQDFLQKMVSELKKLNLIVDDTPASELTVNNIESKIRSVIEQDGGISAVYVDYIQMIGDLEGDKRHLAIAKLSRAFKDFGKKYNIPFISLAQINRTVQSKSDKRPTLSDLKDSGSLEQDADAVLMLYRDEYYDENTENPGVTELKVVKNRDGRTGLVKLRHDLGTCTYKEIIEPRVDGRIKTSNYQ